MNQLERRVKTELEAIGYGVHRSGWPDFLITKDGLLHSVVEVKGYGDVVRPHQKQLHDILIAAGIKVHIVEEGWLSEFLWGMKATAPPEWQAERERPATRLDPNYRAVASAVDAAVDPKLWDRVMPPRPRDDGDAAQVGVK